MKRRNTRTAALTLALALATGCGDADGENGGVAETQHGPGSSDPTAGPTTSQPTTTRANDGEAGGPDTGHDVGDCRPASQEVSSEAMSFSTRDDKEIVGTLHRPAEGTCLPAVLLVHQYMRDRWQWGGLPEALVQRGYLVLAIDLRGHGESDEQDGYLPELLTDPNQAPLDVQAALEWMQAHEAVDATRIGMVGTSIGAYLAAVAVVRQWGVSAIVPISPLTEAIRALAQHDGEIVLGDVYCIATEHDTDGAQARSCEDLVDEATGNTEIRIFHDAADHGVAILERFPELETPIADWLDQML